MTDSAKIMAAGCAAGAAAAVIPTVYGIVKTFSRPLEERDRLTAQGDGFVTAAGKQVFLRGINLADALPELLRDGEVLNAGSSEIFSLLGDRFGSYGARQLFERYGEGLVSDKDVKYISKLGANCVRIPLRSELLFKKDGCKGDPELDRLDHIVAKCRKAGLYVIFDLHSAPGFQNNDISCGKADSCRFFEQGKEGFEARNAAVRLWSRLAAHYKDEPAVAGYDLLNRPLLRVADWEKSLDTLHKFYYRAFRAIRNSGSEQIVIMQAAHGADTLPDPAKYEGKNVAFGLYSHFHTTFETDALVKSLGARGGRRVPFIVCKLRTDVSPEYPLSALSDAGVSWLIGDFKGSGASALYYGVAGGADIAADGYEEIASNLAGAAATPQLTENTELAAELKVQFGRRYSAASSESIEKPEKGFKFKLGFNAVVGVK